VGRVPLARNLGVRISGALFLVLNAAFMALMLLAAGAFAQLAVATIAALASRLRRRAR
jgi:hypothetical protein